MDVDINAGYEDLNMDNMEMERGEDDDDENYEDYNDNEGPDQSECPICPMMYSSPMASTLHVRSSRSRMLG